MEGKWREFGPLGKRRVLHAGNSAARHSNPANLVWCNLEVPLKRDAKEGLPHADLVLAHVGKGPSLRLM